MLQAFKCVGGGRAVCVDLLESRLDMAKKMGADEVIAPEAGVNTQNIGDVVFETAGSSTATAQLFRMANPGGCVVQIGWPDGNKVELDVAAMMEKELDYVGVNRYANAFEPAVTWLADGRVKTDGIITQRYPFDKSPEAFRWALEHPWETIKVIVEH